LAGYQCFGSRSGLSGQDIRRAKTTNENGKKLRNFMFEELDVLYSVLKASPVAWISFI
jgi:hypothetical protein